MPENGIEERVAPVRRFNRFYTRRIGVLEERFLGSPYSLTQARLLYELGHRDGPTASEIAGHLRLDQGYLSRILAGFERQGLIRRTRSRYDGRKNHLALTEAGGAALAELEEHSNRQMARMLAGLAPPEQARLLEAMSTIEEVLRERHSHGRRPGAQRSRGREGHAVQP